MVWADPLPPVMVKDHIFTFFFFWTPSLILSHCTPSAISTTRILGCYRSAQSRSCKGLGGAIGSQYCAPYLYTKPFFFAGAGAAAEVVKLTWNDYEGMVGEETLNILAGEIR